MTIKKNMASGDIFAIPLFLPSFQEWRELDELMDYKKYKFHDDDIFAFGRLIELQTGNMNLIEIFSYAGKIPQSPEVIIQSGRLFEPVMMVGAFSKGRWRLLFDDPHYDKWKDSDYENISFMLGMGTTLWKGGEQTHVTWQQGRELKQSGVSDMIVHGSVGLEVKIRALLTARGLDLNYEQTVEERREEYPKPRDLDRKLKETIFPFRWLSDAGRYSVSLDAGLLNGDCFAKNNMLGNGYDWEKIASIFIETHMITCKEKVTFDCEADTFSVRSSSKKILKEFALSFHKFVLDSDAFEELLRQVDK